MAYKFFDDYTSDFVQSDSGQTRISALSEDNIVDLPDATFVRDADITRDGTDLILEANGETVIIEGYFTVEPTPMLSAPDGTRLTPELVESFTRGGNEYANTGTQANDASPVGAVQEISGEATVTRLDGSVETIGLGTPIYPGDIVETNEEGAVNIMFVDETTFAVSEDARLAIDEYVFDPTTQSGTSNFSVLKGVFVFTSGLIGRDDPDDVMIDTPSGSIGIRGTIIAGDVDTGEITVIEGAIVLTDFSGNSVTLADQYETAKFNPSTQEIEYMGNLGAEEVSGKFMSVSTVAADLFSSIEDSANDTSQNATENGNNNQSEAQQEDTDAQASQQVSENEESPSAAEEKQANEEVNDQNQTNEETNASDDGTSKNDDVETLEQDTQASPNSENGEQSENTQGAEPQIITSDDITGAGTKGTTDPELKSAVASKTTTEIKTATNETNTVGDRPTLNIREQDPPPFNIEVKQLQVNEGQSGVNVAIIRGFATQETNASLIGVSNNFYDINRIDDNTLIVRLKPGVTAQPEHPYPLAIAASSATSGNVIQKIIPLKVTNSIDDATVYNGMPNNAGQANNAFAGSDNSKFYHDFSKDFYDPDGDIASYSFTYSALPTDVNAGSFSTSSDGRISFDLNTNVGTSTFSFTVNALDQDGNVLQSENIDYNIYDNNTSAVFLAATGEVYSGNAAIITDIGTNNKIFTQIDAGENTIISNGSGAEIHLGAGNDTVTFTGGTGNYAFGEIGDDTFDMTVVQNYAYGGYGNDTFKILSNTEVTELETRSTGILLDGGHGNNDTFHLSTGGNIDFTAINDGFIKNIERLGLIDTGTGQNVTISYTDVVNMTDHNDTLRIDLDAGDTLNFVNNNSDGFDMYQVGSNSDYNIYSDGIITLLVDTDANITGLP